MDIGPLLEGQTVDIYTLKKSVDRGHYGAVFRAINRIGKSFALKLVPVRLYEQVDKSFESEISRYHKLGQHPHIATLEDAGSISLKLLEEELNFYFIVMEWVEGITLTEFIKNKPQTASEIISVIFDVTAGLERFEDKNLWHNDLNSDNILVRQLDPTEIRTRKISSPYICKIVDIGSAVFRGEKHEDRLSDLQFLASHMNELKIVALAEGPQSTREEQFILDGVSTLVSRLFDENQARSIDTATTLMAELTSLFESRLLLANNEVVELDDPFGYLNANDFPNDGYINYLFSGSIPWIGSIASPESQGTLITGPRGCGKTIILRSMRLSTRILPHFDGEKLGSIQSRFNRDEYLAFFVSARIDIGNHCSLKKLPPWAQSEELTVYYFILLFVTEVLHAIEYGQVRNIWNLDPISEWELCDYVSTSLGLVRSGGISALATQVKRQQNILVLNQISEPPSGSLLNSNFFTGLVAKLHALSNLFERKNIVFLLDDFSSPKVPVKVQRTLLPLIWNSGGNYSFRVSAHSESVVTEDLRGNHYKLNREFREINLGRSYLEAIALSSSEETVTDFVDDIFARRFAFSKSYKGRDLKELLGEDNGGPIAERLRELSEKQNARHFRYCGRNTVMKLCSGDISYLIDMLGQMLRLSNEGQISVNTQHRVIRQYAWRELYRLRDATTSGGVDLYQIALIFGKFSRFKLLERRPGKQKRDKPKEYLKIEIEMDDISNGTSEAIVELLQSGVFIDGGFSNSGKGSPARKLWFRKIFTPAFPTTYNSANTLPMTAKSFEAFVVEPDKFLRTRVAEGGVGPSDQSSFIDQLAQTVDQ